MSDTRNHTTRDQLADTDEFWLCNSSDHVRYSTHDYCLVHETPIPTDDRCPVTVAKLAAVRAAAVAETTATIEGIGEFDAWLTVAPGVRVRVMHAHDVRAALSGGRTALDTMPPVDPDDLCLTCGATNGVCRCHKPAEEQPR